MKIPVPTIVPPSRWRRRSAVDILELAATTDRLLVPIERPLATVAVLPPTGEYRHPRNGQVNVPREYAVAILRSFANIRNRFRLPMPIVMARRAM
ncbi:hypothetical protein [Candidatus Amarobacter glycogenicus]|uniref:hypothetical protein n=1 Tax=Candidatus Amarobacter glycogenicus TaxID=3140699 RepID=UPI002A0C75B2|nr:hypothetical protein [Dehalococcoidia bacterium]